MTHDSDEMISEDEVIEERFLRLPEVLGMVGCSRSTWYEMMKNGEVPKQIIISRKYTVWKLSAIKEWMDSKISQAIIKA